jgi:hypothetical protein
MSRGLDIEAVAAQSTFQTVDDLAAYIAVNTDTPVKKMAKVTGLPAQELTRLMSNKGFREKLTEFLTYSELTPERERRILRRMLDVASDKNTEFRDFRDAATWVYRQGGMLRSEKSNVDVTGAVRVAFTLDAAASDETQILDSYVAPDPFAGVVGLPGSTAEEETDMVDVTVGYAGVEADTEKYSRETDWVDTE